MKLPGAYPGNPNALAKIAASERVDHDDSTTGAENMIHALRHARNRLGGHAAFFLSVCSSGPRAGIVSTTPLLPANETRNREQRLFLRAG